MEELVKNFLQYLSQQKCKDIAVFNTTIDGQNTNSIIVSMSNVIENKRLADKIMKDFDFDAFPEGYNKGEWIIFDFDKDDGILGYLSGRQVSIPPEKIWFVNDFPGAAERIADIIKTSEN